MILKTLKSSKNRFFAYIWEGVLGKSPMNTQTSWIKMDLWKVGHVGALEKTIQPPGVLLPPNNFTLQCLPVFQCPGASKTGLKKTCFRYTQYDISKAKYGFPKPHRSGAESIGIEKGAYFSAQGETSGSIQWTRIAHLTSSARSCHEKTFRMKT